MSYHTNGAPAVILFPNALPLRQLLVGWLVALYPLCLPGLASGGFGPTLRSSAAPRCSTSASCVGTCCCRRRHRWSHSTNCGSRLATACVPTFGWSFRSESRGSWLSEVSRPPYAPCTLLLVTLASLACASVSVAASVSHSGNWRVLRRDGGEHRLVQPLPVTRRAGVRCKGGAPCFVCSEVGRAVLS